MLTALALTVLTALALTVLTTLSPDCDHSPSPQQDKHEPVLFRRRRWGLRLSPGDVAGPVYEVELGGGVTPCTNDWSVEGMCRVFACVYTYV